VAVTGTLLGGRTASEYGFSFPPKQHRIPALGTALSVTTLKFLDSHSALPWLILEAATSRAREAAMLVSAASGAVTSELRNAHAAQRGVYLVCITLPHLARATLFQKPESKILSLPLTNNPWFQAPGLNITTFQDLVLV
jgi:hypothetical protein